MDDFKTLQDLLPRLARRKRRSAIVAFDKDKAQRWTYAKLAQAAGRLAAGLNKRGLEKGDHLAICAGNRPEWIAACLGILAAGGVVVPLDVQLADDVLRHTLSDSHAKYVFTTPAALERVKRIARRTKCKPILLGPRAKGVRGWQDLFARRTAPVITVTPEDRAALFYTSGTTGPPKGVPLTHGNLAFQLNTVMRADLVEAHDRVLLPLPLHHVYPFTIGVLTPLALGLPIVLPYTLTGPQLMRAIHQGKVTTIIGVPRLYQALFSGIEERAAAAGVVPKTLFRALLGLSVGLRHLHVRIGRLVFLALHRKMGPRLRVLASGGAALDPDLAWKLEGLGWLIATGYGLTETSPLLTLDKPGQARLGSVGRVVDGVEVRIDPTESDGQKPHKAKRKTKTPSREKSDGEVVARGPSVFAGYHKLPKKTEEAFTDDGWFRTGDLGHFDGAGYLFITGRAKTLIVLQGGEKVQPDEVEEAYQQSSGIREVGILQRDGKLVAVVFPDRRLLEQGADSKDTASKDAGHNAVQKALQQRSKSLASYQRIDDFVLATAPLPRTRLGKIRREELQDLYDQIKAGKAEPVEAAPIAIDAMSPEDQALLDDAMVKQTWDWLAERFARQHLTPESSLKLDLGLDSLEWLNLTLGIRECCGVELGEEAIGRIETVRDLLREVAEQPQGKHVRPAADPLEEPNKVLGKERQRWLAPLGPIETAVAKFFYALNWVLVHSAFRLSTRGREHLPDQGPFVLTPNHSSYLDSFVLAASLDYKLLANTYWAGWTGVAFGPLFRILRRICHVVPIDPDKAAATSLAFGAAVLHDKHNMVWYPEGGHSKTGQLGPLKPGTGSLLKQFPVPVVPVHIEGTRDSLPPGHWVPRPGRIRIEFGAPLDPRKLEKKGQGDEPHERITDALRHEMSRLGGDRDAPNGR